MFRNSKGITLLEILIVAAVGAAAGALLISSMVSSNDVFYRETGRVQEGLSLNSALTVIGSDIKSAAKVSVSYPESGQVVHQSSSEALVLKLPSIDSAGGVIEDTYDFIIFYKDSNNPLHLVRKVIPTSPSQKGAEDNILLKNLKKISFRYLDKNGNTVSPSSAEKINFLINTETKFGLNAQVSSSSSEVNLRND